MEIKVFIEYKIISEKRDMFMQLLPDLKQNAAEHGGREYKIYEGTDQPNLIVEEFLLQDIERYQMIKAERLNPDSPFWSKHHEHIAGGADKLHIWAFKALE
ncbi:hypothetical protein [Paenibacillus abyssi]|uniref:NIPSNAP domain-containing protein n=1 Tax=Paenibacillus abyssi TaxID=1340531 RepID=A0A917CZH0_9BACL|nr:hypothetical protein [Paenibacillus abyssi]GGG01872.1 hypothetical protein GCM10010916_18790 [Paenibacillus abyssi]